MSLELTLILLVAVLFLFLVAGTEVGVALGWLGIIGLVVIAHHPLIDGARMVWDLNNSFVLTAVPLFVFMGEIFHNSGATRRLFLGVDKWVGVLPGGIACTVVGACAIFAAISGSSVATAATMGTLAVPEMEARKYEPKLMLGTVAAGGTLGILIPPSINLIIYGAWETLSVAELFAAGLIPGIILATLFMLMIIIVVRLNPSLAPPVAKFSWRQRFLALSDLLPWLMAIGIVLGGIFAGMWTPTEAAAVGVVCALVLALAYRQLNFQMLKRSLANTVRLTCLMLFVVSGARILVFLILYLGMGEWIASFILGAVTGKFATLALVYLMYLIMGCFFEALSMMLLTLPFVALIIAGLGLDLVWFGIPLVLTMEAGLITPPVGMNLYALQGVARKYDVMTIAVGAAPFLLPMFVVIALVTVYPELVMWLPCILYPALVS